MSIDELLEEEEDALERLRLIATANALDVEIEVKIAANAAILAHCSERLTAHRSAELEKHISELAIEKGLR